MKPIVQRPWGRRHSQGWVINKADLIEALKKGKALRLDGITVGAEQLRRLINLLPGQDILLRSNGRLEIETVAMTFRKVGDSRRAYFHKPKHYHQFLGILDGAWVPRAENLTVVALKPRKF